MSKLVPAVAERYYLQGMLPIVRGLSRLGVTPNVLTSVGAVLIVIAGVAFARAQMHLGGGLLLLSGVIDTLDGQVARLYGKASKFGAFYDSTLDRVGDGAIFIGLAVFFDRTTGMDYRDEMVLVSLIAMLATQLVSYMRARAEGLGLDCKVGIAQRAERILGLGIPTLVFGARVDLLAVIVVVLLLLSLITVGQRFIHVYRTAPGPNGH